MCIKAIYSDVSSAGPPSWVVLVSATDFPAACIKDAKMVSPLSE